MDEDKRSKYLGIGRQMPGMSEWGSQSSSGIAPSRALRKLIKERAESRGAPVRVIIKGTHLEHESVKIKKGKKEEEWQAVLDKVGVALPATKPCFVLIFRETDAVLVTYIPELVPPREKMLYASSKASVKMILSEQILEFNVTVQSEVTAEEYDSRQNVEAPLTEQERYEKEYADMETGGSYSMLARVLGKDGHAAIGLPGLFKGPPSRLEDTKEEVEEGEEDKKDGDEESAATDNQESEGEKEKEEVEEKETTKKRSSSKRSSKRVSVVAAKEKEHKEKENEEKEKAEKKDKKEKENKEKAAAMALAAAAVKKSSTEKVIVRRGSSNKASPKARTKSPSPKSPQSSSKRSSVASSRRSSTRSTKVTKDKPATPSAIAGSAGMSSDEEGEGDGKLMSLSSLLKAKKAGGEFDMTKLESHLTVKSFEKHFKMSFDAFGKLPGWKKQQLKKKVGLF